MCGIFRGLLFGIEPLFIVSFKQNTQHDSKATARKIFAFSLYKDMEMLYRLEEECFLFKVRSYASKRAKSNLAREGAKKRKLRKRRTWYDFQSNLTNRQFRRYFRMSRECFNLLCDQIKENVGEREFKSESFLQEFLNGHEENNMNARKFLSCTHSQYRWLDLWGD